MLVQKFMSDQLTMIRPEASLQEAAETMAQNNIGFLPVSNGQEIVGVISDRDLVISGMAKGLNAGTTKVEEVMNPQVITCQVDQAIDEAIMLMERHQVRRLVVYTSTGRPTGLLSLDDLAVKYPDEKIIGSMLHRIAEGTSVA